MSLFGRIAAWSDARESRKARRAMLRSPDRYRSRLHRQHARNLEAAAESNLFFGWSTGPTPINRTVMQSLRGTRARSRERVLNDPYAKRFTYLLKNNVVGHVGPRLQSQARTSKGKPDKQLRDIVEHAWADFSTSRSFDMGGRLPFRAFMEAMLTDVATDGEALVRIYRGRSAGPWGIAFQLLDSDELDVRLNGDLGDGYRIVMGVELDPFDRAIGYWFRPPTTADPLARGTALVHYRVPADEILHVYVVEKARQVRGLPWFGQSITSMKMLHGYHQDAAKAARVGANQSFFLKTTTGDEVVAGTQERDDGSLEIPFDDDLIGHQLSDGDEVVPWNPPYPHQQFPEFTKAMLRRISAGLNVPYPSLANDPEGVNYSTLRSFEIEVREAWKSVQSWVFEAFCRPAYEAWLESALLNKQIVTQSGTALVPSLEDRLRAHRWQGKRWTWVDPLKDASANKMLSEMGALSVSEIIESMGGDPEETRERIAAERIEMQRLGIAVSASTAPAPAVAVDPDPDDMENGDDGDAE